MQDIHDILPLLASYQTAILALSILCLSILLQAILNAPLGFAGGKQEPGMPLRGTHEDLSFRVLRTHMNSVENFPAFIVAVAMAIVAGADALWVNWLAAIHVAFRILFWIVYYAGIGKVAGGPRTIAYVGGWLTNIALIAMAIFALIG